MIYIKDLIELLGKIAPSVQCSAGSCGRKLRDLVNRTVTLTSKTLQSTLMLA